jgi:RNase P subunit RPR2
MLRHLYSIILFERESIRYYTAWRKTDTSREFSKRTDETVPVVWRRRACRGRARLETRGREAEWRLQTSAEQWCRGGEPEPTSRRRRPEVAVVHLGARRLLPLVWRNEMVAATCEDVVGRVGERAMSSGLDRRTTSLQLPQNFFFKLPAMRTAVGSGRAGQSIACYMPCWIVDMLISTSKLNILEW